MKYKERYYELRHAMKLLNALQVFEQFNYMNLFYLLDEKTKGIVLFTEDSNEKTKGLQIHFGDAGINYLSDSMMSKSGFIMNGLSADMVMITIVKKEKLLPQDKAFLKKYGIRPTADFNIIPFEFQEGYDCTYLTLAKMKLAISYIYYLLSLIKNDREDILTAFEKEQLVLAAFDTEKNMYEVRYADDFILGKFPNFKKVNQSFVEEYKNSVYVDDTCYICRYFAPTKNEFGSYDSILLAYYKKKDAQTIVTISCKPNQVGEYITGFLDDVFKKEGLPTRIMFNHRLLLAVAYKTLATLNIEIAFSREIEEVDNLFLDYITETFDQLEEGENKKNFSYVS